MTEDKVVKTLKLIIESLDEMREITVEFERRMDEIESRSDWAVQTIEKIKNTFDKLNKIERS